MMGTLLLRFINIFCRKGKNRTRTFEKPSKMIPQNDQKKNVENKWSTKNGYNNAKHKLEKKIVNW